MHLWCNLQEWKWIEAEKTQIIDADRREADYFLEEEPAIVQICSETTPRREHCVRKIGEIFVPKNLAIYRDARTNYHPLSQQSVPFLIPAPSHLSPILLLKVLPTSAFDLLQSRRSMSPRESVHGRFDTCLPFPPCSLSLSLSMALFTPDEIPWWSRVQNDSSNIDYPRSRGATYSFLIQEVHSCSSWRTSFWQIRGDVFRSDTRDNLCRDAGAASVLH